MRSFTMGGTCDVSRAEDKTITYNIQNKSQKRKLYEKTNFKYASRHRDGGGTYAGILAHGECGGS